MFGCGKDWMRGMPTISRDVYKRQGKEASLKRFLKQGREEREAVLVKMTPIIDDIFHLWETVEGEFPKMVQKNKHYYGAKKYAKFDDGKMCIRDSP